MRCFIPFYFFAYFKRSIAVFRGFLKILREGFFFLRVFLKILLEGFFEGFFAVFCVFLGFFRVFVGAL